VWETILEKKYDNRNFRKKALKSYVIPIDEFEMKVGHRPAKLYRMK
jgi:hypothetical protein